MSEVKYGIQHKVIAPLSGAYGHLINIREEILSPEKAKKRLADAMEMIQSVMDLASRELPPEGDAHCGESLEPHVHEFHFQNIKFSYNPYREYATNLRCDCGAWKPGTKGIKP